jgi:hypothetical protein
MNLKGIIPVSFAGSATSGAFEIWNAGTIVGINVPASFTATSLRFQASETLTGTYADVKNEAGNNIVITVDGANASWIDLTNVFPISVKFGKLVASTSITNTVELIQRKLADA